MQEKILEQTTDKMFKSYKMKYLKQRADQVITYLYF